MVWLKKFFCSKPPLFVLALALTAFITFNSRVVPTQANSEHKGTTVVRYIPPQIPGPDAPSGRRRGGASRGGCPAVDRPLTALVPATTMSDLREYSDLNTYKAVWGLTITARPTLWFYIPYLLTPKLPIEFVLQDDRGNDVYQTTLTLSKVPPGIMGFHIPSTVAPLKVDRMYHWYFLVDCDRPPISVDGWIKRIPIAPIFSKSQNQASQKQAAFYAENGLWYDALTTLAQLRIARPNDSTLLNNWVDLLQSVGLEMLAYQQINSVLQ